MTKIQLCHTYKEANKFAIVTIAGQMFIDILLRSVIIII